METLSSPTLAATTFRTSRGRSTPLGATPFAEGVNFVLMCRHGTSVSLVIQQVDNDDVLAVAVDAVLTRQTGPVVVNLTTSMLIDDIAASHSAVVHRTPVGEANVVEEMLACDAVIGGEGGNGGVIFPAVQHCRDSYAGMALWLDVLAGCAKTVSQLTAEFPRYYRRSATVAIEHGWLGTLMQRLSAEWPAARLDRRDGLKLMLDNGWVHARASNTEPILRLSVEAKSAEQAEELFTRAKEILSLSAPSRAK